jgi:leader peptidase (prepilin peptidase) / N-methyltransferase
VSAAISTLGAMALAVGMAALAHECARGNDRCLRPGITLAIALGTCALVEAVAAFGTQPIPAARLALLACTGVSAATDLQTGYIFDRVTLGSALLIAALAIRAGASLDALFGALAFGGALALPFALTRRRAIGFGDVKFAGAAGLALGAAASMQALWVACISGGGVAMLAILTRRVGRKTRMPFGPFLAFGICVALVAGTR